MPLLSDNQLYPDGDARAESNRLSLARGAQHWPLWSRRLLALGWQQRRSLVVMFVLGLTITGTYVAQGFLVAAALTRVLVDGSLDGLAGFVAGALFMVVLRGGLLWWREALGAAHGEQVVVALRSRLYRQIVRLGPAWLEQTRSGAVLTTLTEAVDALAQYFRLFVSQAAVAAIGATAITAYLWTVDPVVGAFVTVCALGGALGPIFAWRVLGPRERFWWQEVPAMRAEFLDSMQGMPTLKALGATQPRRTVLSARTLTVRNAWISLTKAECWAHAPGWLLLAAGVILSGGVAAVRLAQGEIDGAALLIALILARECFRPVADFQLALHLTYKGISGGELVLDVLDAVPTVQDTCDATPKLSAPELRFQSVSFTYPTGSRPAVADLSFTLAPGEHVALVGRSGAGKSTVVGLLMRFADPSTGHVSVGGHDLRDLDLSHYRSHIALVSQDTYLFHGTVRDNLLLARPEATEEQLRSACRGANADEFISTLPDGYDTVVAERGARLSGGQRQRIAIARALLKDAPILVLDEATSSVDVASEAAIHQALDRLTTGRTTLVIAHRLSTVRDADRILVLEEGRLVESGAHSDLLHADGAYQRLVQAQERA